MDKKQSHFFNGKMIIGIAIITFGLLALLDNFGIVSGVKIWEYWPLILIFIGVGFLFQPKEYRQYFSGIILLVIGGFFLVRNLIETFDFNIGDLWPVILVIVGIKILAHGFWRSKKGPISKDHIDISAILGGGKFNIPSKQFKGGKVFAILGGCVINLRDADFKEESIVIDTFAMMGGIEVRVPLNWEVSMQGVPILGGMEDKTLSGSDAGQAKNKQLIIKGTSIMGGVEVKN